MKACQLGYFLEKNKKTVKKFVKLRSFITFARVKIKKTQKQVQMKKLFTILAVAGLMTACNNAEKTEAAADSLKAAVDTAKAAMDTAKAAMDTAKAKMDTTKAKM